MQINKFVCPVTGENAEFYCQKEQAIYLKSKYTNVIFLQNMPVSQAMQDYVDEAYEHGVYQDYIKAKDLKLLTADVRLNQIEKFTPGKKMLDVGCSAGFFMQQAQLRGFDVTGIEFSIKAIDQADLSIKHKIMHGEVQQAIHQWQGTLDIVCAFDIIEHMQDPANLTRHLYAALKEGGLLVLSTPDTSHYLRYLMRSKWPMLQPLQHMVLFSKKAMKRMLLAQGFRDVITQPTYKYLSFDYLAKQLKKSNKLIYKIMSVIGRLLPKKITRHRFAINIGEFIVFARK